MQLAEQTGAQVERLVDLDPGIPGLPLLLDDDALHDWLVRLFPGGPRVRARRTYLRWKPGAGGVLRVRIDDPAGRTAPGWDGQHGDGQHGSAEEDLYLAVWHRDSAAKLDKTVLRGGRGVLAVDREALAVLARPAADRDLPGLGRLHTAGTESTLRRLQPVDEQAHRLLRRAARHGTAVRTLAYKPQRRWVGLVGGTPDVPADRTLVLRAHRPVEAAGLVRRHRAAQAALGDDVARLLGADTRRGLLTVGHVPGRTLDRLGPGDTLAGAVGAGALLARLHGAHPGAQAWERLPVRTRGQEEDDVRAAAAVLEVLVPGAGAASVSERLLVALRGLGDPPEALLHGDLSADQVVVGPDGATTLIDLDEVGRGPVSHDLAGAAASWALSDPSTAAARLAALLDGYSPHAPVPPAAELRARTAVHVLRRAPEAFRAGSPTWPSQVRDAVALAHDVLDGTAVVP